MRLGGRLSPDKLVFLQFQSLAVELEIAFHQVTVHVVEHEGEETLCSLLIITRLQEQTWCQLNSISPIIFMHNIDEQNPDISLLSCMCTYYVVGHSEGKIL